MENKILDRVLSQEIDPAYARRSQLILLSIVKQKPRKILDIGCGRGFYITMCSKLLPDAEIYGIDTNLEYIAKATDISDTYKNIKIKEGSIYKIPFENNTFDAIICSEVMEHLTDEANALHELKRVLKPKGSLYLTVPSSRFPILWDPLNWFLMKFFKTHVNKDIWWLAGIWADHERLYTQESLSSLVQERGFKVYSSETILHYCWPFTHFVLYGIGKNIIEILKVEEFSRFNIEKTSKASVLLARIMSFPERTLRPRLKPKKYMNIFLHVKPK